MYGRERILLESQSAGAFRGEGTSYGVRGRQPKAVDSFGLQVRILPGEFSGLPSLIRVLLRRNMLHGRTPESSPLHRG
jgi:hypothetical protein